MRSMFALLSVVLFLATSATADVGPKPDIVAPHSAPIKVCSPFVESNWRAAIMVPHMWVASDCRDYAGSINATAFQVGCFYTDPARRSGPQHALARTNRPPLPAADCGWSTSFSLTWPGPTKVCSILVPGGWRSLTMVPASWTASDCQALAREFRATRVQLGCIFHAPTPPKYAWASRHAGTDAPLPDGALYRPATDCGWASGGAPPAARTIPTKFCSGYVPGAWRTVTVVPPAWQPSDCQAFSRQIGATFYQLGCIFDTPPTGSTEKFVSGPAHAILRPAADAPLLRNCAWRVT